MDIEETLAWAAKRLNITIDEARKEISTITNISLEKDELKITEHYRKIACDDEKAVFLNLVSPNNENS